MAKVRVYFSTFCDVEVADCKSEEEAIEYAEKNYDWCYDENELIENLAIQEGASEYIS